MELLKSVTEKIFDMLEVGRRERGADQCALLISL